MNLETSQWLEYSILDNPVRKILVFAGIIVFGMLLRRLFSKLSNYIIYLIIKRKGEDTSAELFFSLLARPMELLWMLAIYFLAFDYLEFPEWWNLVDAKRFGLKMVISRLYETGIAIALAWLLLRLIDYFVQRYLDSQTDKDSPLNKQLIPFLKELAKAFLVVLAIFTTLGVVYKLDIGAIIAGLGIGGLAVALAGKETLENLFGSFTIFLDKPFVVGDLISVDDATGTVESIGFRSTRIRTFDQTLVVMPNKNLIYNRLENFTERTHRRAKYTLGVLYSTPPSSLKNLINEIYNYLNHHPMLDQNSIVNLAGFSSSTIEIEVIYFVASIDYKRFAEVREEVNFEILSIMAKLGCQFAFPSTTVYMAR